MSDTSITSSNSEISASPDFTLNDLKEPEVLSNIIHKLGHDIGNPLTAIISLGSFIQRIIEEDKSEISTDKIIGYLDSMLSESWRIGQLNERLVLLFSVQTNNSELSPLKRVIEKSIEKIRSSKDFADLKYNLTSSSDDLSIQIEPSQLQALISELICNAWREQKLSDINVPINISTLETSDGHVIFEVENLSKEENSLELVELFKPFVKGDPYKKTTGLGLSICWAIIERAGGIFKISLSNISNSPGVKKFKASFSVPKKVLEIDLSSSKATDPIPAKASPMVNQVIGNTTNPVTHISDFKESSEKNISGLKAEHSLLLISDNEKLAKAISNILALTLGKRTKLTTEIIDTKNAFLKTADFYSQDAAIACWQVKNQTPEELYQTLKTHNPKFEKSFAYFSTSESLDLKNYSKENSLSYVAYPFSPEDLLNLILKLLN